MAAVLKGYLSTQSLPVGMEQKMAGLQLVNPTSYSRVEELSELSGLIAEEDELEDGEGEGEEDRDTDVEYDVIQREEAADMPSQFPRCGYGAISPGSLHRKRRRKRRRLTSSYSQDVPPHFSLSPQHLLRENNDLHHPPHRHRRYFSTTALAQVHGRATENRDPCRVLYTTRLP